LRVGIPVVAGLAALGLGYLLAAERISPASPEPDGGSLVRVPDLVGLAEADARSRLEDLGLGFSVRSGMRHPRAPERAILAQTPLPGQLARPGAPVEVTVSLGPERHAVPEIHGLTERQATIVLERLGYRVRVDRSEAPLEEGRAVGTRPPAGTDLEVPADVALIVSAGPPVSAVPDLTGRHIDDALDLLREAGLELGVISYDPTAPEAPGRIVGQYPPAGYSLRHGDAVELRVAGRPDEGGRRAPSPEDGER
jgi:serine/threonine-protein kinase